MAVMRAGIMKGLGIGFFTPFSFLNEIRRGEIAQVPLVGSDLLPEAIGLYADRGHVLVSSRTSRHQFPEERVLKPKPITFGNPQDPHFLANDGHHAGP